MAYVSVALSDCMTACPRAKRGKSGAELTKFARGVLG
jgi:hypothetical protein